MIAHMYSVATNVQIYNESANPNPPGVPMDIFELTLLQAILATDGVARANNVIMTFTS